MAVRKSKQVGAALLCAAGVGLAGCASSSTAAPPPSGAASSSAPETGTPKPTPKPTTPPTTPSTSRPVQSRPPAPVDGTCPYAGAEQIAETIGQHISRTTVTRTRPHPGCSFYRPNGEQAVDIQVSVLASAVAAQTRAIQLGGASANPVTGVGDGGVVAITDTGALLAVSKGAALVVVKINQKISLEAREIAGYVVGKI
jgi:hypothetical protein